MNRLPVSSPNVCRSYQDAFDQVVEISYFLSINILSLVHPHTKYKMSSGQVNVKARHLDPTINLYVRNPTNRTDMFSKNFV